MNRTAPVRVLHVVVRMDRGGIETFLMNLFRNIDRSRFRFDFLVHGITEGAYEPEIHALGGRIHRVPQQLNPLQMYSYRRRVSSVLSAYAPHDIVHAHLNAFNGMFLTIARSSGMRVRIAHSHTTSSSSLLREPLWSVIKRWGRGSFTHRLATSKAAARWAFGRAAGDSTIVQNGIDLQRFHFAALRRAAVRARLDLGDRIIIGHVGRFDAIKNQGFLLEVLACLIAAEMRVGLLFVGDGPDSERIKRSVAERGLSNHVFFAGDVADVESYYSAMDCFALPSISEGLGIVAIEAQASGLPCVLSTGVPEEAAISKNVRRIPLSGNRNANLWAAQLLEFGRCSRSALRNCVDSRLEPYDINQAGRKLVRIYESLQG